MSISKLASIINAKQSNLCVGLDIHYQLLPKGILKNKKNLVDYTKQIIDATKQHAAAYKPNLAFYESLGNDAFYILEEIVNYIPKNIFIIADAKRSDIGNTAKMYAKTYFEHFSFDAVTVNPYLGFDSLSPFFEYKDKSVIILGLTSNKGADDFQKLVINNRYLYEFVIENALKWYGSNPNTMFVVGATQVNELERIKVLVGDKYILVPGIGAQGGSIETVCHVYRDKALVNVGRAIIETDIDLMNEVAKNYKDKIRQSIEVS